MKEIVRVNLDNEMDLILAHRRSMKIAELCGLTHTFQTRFATAVSEIARCSIANGRNSSLALGIRFNKGAKKDIVASISDTVDLRSCNPDAYVYANKLSGNLSYETDGQFYTTSLDTQIPFSGTISEKKIEGFKDYFMSEPPMSPYDELRKKNIQLIELAEKLSESESKYRGLSDNLPLLVFTINEANELSMANKWLKEYLGRPFTAFNKRGLEGIVHPEDIEKVLDDWHQAKRRKVKFSSQARIMHDDKFIWHLISFMPQKSDSGETLGWIGFFVDIDAQKQIETALQDNSELRHVQAELKHINFELLQKNSELEQMAFIASHDLQEPLRKIMTITSMAERHFTAEQKQRVYFDRINLAAARMSNLITDVLNYSRVSKTADDFERVNLNEVIDEVLDDLDLYISEKNANVIVGKLPHVNGIRFQMYQLFFNLIGNSLKFTESDPLITINVAQLPPGMQTDNFLSAHTYCMIEVTDNGIGIEDFYTDKIFRMFQRLHNREKFAGNGIGLALCKKIVENHRGAIAFESKPGEGTTFKIALPCS